ERERYDRPILHVVLDEAMDDIQAENRTVDLCERPELSVESAVPANLVLEMLIQGGSGDLGTATDYLETGSDTWDEELRPTPTATDADILTACAPRETPDLAEGGFGDGSPRAFA